MDESTTTAPQAAADVAESRRAQLRAGYHRIDLAKAWKRAQKAIKDASGLDVVKETRKVADPVQRARRIAEVSSAMDMRLSVMLTLGCDPDELERDKSGVRLMLEGAHKRLGIVGLRTGEAIEHDLSPRFQAFMERFAQFRARAPRGAIIDGEAHQVDEGDEHDG